MSVSNTNRKSGPYTCNGVTVSFPFDFTVFANSDVLVVLADSIGNESPLVLGTDYTVTLNSDQDSNPGGTVVTTVARPTGYSVTLTSQVENLQPTVFTNAGGFYPSVLNKALDRLTIMVQQVAEQVSRAVKVDISSSIEPGQLIDTLNTNAENAVAAASSAATSATNAATSAAAASGSATSASSSATSASNSAASASTSATSASGSATAAASSADTATTKALEASSGAASASSSAASASSSAASVLSIASSISNAQAETNALLGLGIGGSYVDSNGHLIMAYVPPVTEVQITATGYLTLTY